MSADRRPQDGRIIATARQEIADLALDRVGAVDVADALDGKHGAQPRPAAEGFETHCIGAGEYPAPDQAAMAVLERVADSWRRGARAKAMLLEVRRHRRL